MRPYRPALAICCAAFLSGCGQVEIVTPHVPASLRQPEPVPSLSVETVNELAAAAVRTRGALQTVNDRVRAIDCILTAAEQDASLKCERTDQ